MSGEDLAVGDSVTWTHSSSNGRTLKLSARAGTIIHLSETTAMAKMRNGKRVILPIARFRKAGRQSEIADAFQAIADAVASKGGAA